MEGDPVGGGFGVNIRVNNDCVSDESRKRESDKEIGREEQ